jgi:release factor glutamine methyltransferase
MSEAVKIWKILDILKVTEELFAKNNISKPRLNAELLLCGALKTKRINLYLDFEKPLNETELAVYRSMVKRRINREPLQYILGEAEFYGLKFFINRSVLIPRQETELLVDKTLEIISTQRLENPKILDIGTGSGCISIAAASRVLCSIRAIDISREAVKTAQANSDLNNTSSRIEFIQKDFINDNESFNGYNLVISNPPYIAEFEINTLEPEVKDYEPKSALSDNSDGLSFYRKIFETAIQTIEPLTVLLETGDGKKEKVEELVQQYGIKNYTFHKDLLNIERVLEINII